MKHEFRKLALVSGIALTLAGFGTTGMAAGTPAGNMGAHANSESVPDQLRDARHEAQIWTTYALNPHLHAFDLKVEVKGDEATLNGKVQSGTAKDLAGQIALGVNGIRHVDNRLVVDAGYQPPRRASGERGFADVVRDATITASIKSKLLWNSHTDGLNIDVDTKRGVVTLAGSVDSGAAKDLAGRIAENTDDVLRVRNQLAVTGKPRMTARARAELSSAANETKQALSDGWITTKVKSSLMLTRDVEGLGISVTTDNGIVSLAGNVDSRADKQHVVEIARDVRGVRKVDSSGIRIE